MHKFTYFIFIYLYFCFMHISMCVNICFRMRIYFLHIYTKLKRGMSRYILVISYPIFVSLLTAFKYSTYPSINNRLYISSTHHALQQLLFKHLSILNHDTVVSLTKPIRNIHGIYFLLIFNSYSYFYSYFTRFQVFIFCHFF